MRILGIDYGTKKIGIAVSDEERKVAFPRTVLPNTWESVRDFLLRLAADEEVSEIVIGLPVGLDGNETPLSRDVRTFAKRVSEALNTPIYFENEVYSSAAVKTATGEARPKNLDAASAAVILQSFLDRRNRGSA